MSAVTGSQVEHVDLDDHDDDDDRPWYRSPSVLIPIASGVAFAAGLVCEWTGAETAGLVLFWIGLLLGAYTFVPGALRKLFTKGKLGIGLLMTISATGAVILGYVEEAAALAFLYSIAEALEDKAMDRARAGLRALLKLVPDTALVKRGDATAEVEAKELRVGDVLVVRPGERIATDGTVRAGRSSLDTSAITGESIPVEVEPGTDVSAGSINTTGVLEVEATAAGTDNSLTTIVELVEQAQAEKGDRARLADRIARPLVPGVMILAVLFLLNRERKHRYHHLRAMCRHDASSGLDNAHALREAWRTSPTRPAVLGFLSLDQVERVLGSYGWRAQSQLLREIGREMVPLARPYHMGGGKFVLLPLGAEQAGASAGKMEEILRRLQAFVFQWHGAQLRVSPYLGVAPCDRVGVEALDECLANACDAALRAREAGEHNPLPCEPSPSGGPDAQERRHRLVAAAEALACVHAGRVELYVQPIVALAGQPSAGFQGEVLCRLRTAQGRLLFPNEFIADLEAGGHASELDIAVIECLFQWLRTHPLAIPGVARLGINLSGKSVASASFRARFAELLRQTPLPHSALCFELTETAVIASQEPALRLFHDLRARGCSLSLDDFGSGMQNSERLRLVPVDSLKIDGQFVRNMQSQSRDLEIVRAAIAVADAHGLATVAEYVESASLAEQLRDMGVKWGQGYHFGRPEPIASRLLPQDVAPLVPVA